MACGLFPICKELTSRGMDEQIPDAVAFSFREQRKITKYPASTFIPSNQMKPLVNENSRSCTESIEHGLKIRRERSSKSVLFCGGTPPITPRERTMALFVARIM